MGLVALARALDRPNLIGVDMGGTSFDVSLVIGGKPDVSTETSLEGFPLLMPIANIHTIGAGGGSIAYAEAGGLRVGPESAGADPGPACYGRGGTRPTVTDANLVLGRIDPEHVRRRAHDARRRRRPRRGRRARRGARPRRRRARRGDRLGDQREDGAGDPDADGRAGNRAARLRARRLRRRRPDARGLPGPGARDRRGDRAAGSPARSRPGGCSRPSCAATSRRPFFRRASDADLDELAADLRADRGRGPRGARGRGRPRGRLPRRALGRHALRGAGVHARDPDRPARTRPTEPGFVEEMARRFNEAHDFRYGHSNPGAPVEFVVASRRRASATSATPSRRSSPRRRSARRQRARATCVFERRRAADRRSSPRDELAGERELEGPLDRRGGDGDDRRAARLHARRSTAYGSLIISIGKED